MRHQAIVLGILGFVFTARSGVTADLRAAESRVNQLLEPIRQEHHLPALAGAVVTSKELIAVGAVGVRKAGTDVAVTVDDLWHLGSDTKAMTAAMIGSLVEEGRLTWETTLEQVFPDLAPSMRPEMRKVTLLELLCHRAGLPHDIPWWRIAAAGGRDLREQRKVAVRLATSAAPQSTPGTRFEYSNTGYVLAGAMAEQVAGESWEDLMTKRLFRPLGMASAGFGGTGTPEKIDQPWPHLAGGSPARANGPLIDNPAVMGPAGRVHCSLADWAKFIADGLRGARGQRAILRRETYQSLITPPLGGSYALGWAVNRRSPWTHGPVLAHMGSNTLNTALARLAPEADFAVLVSTNQGGEEASKACDQAAMELIREFYSGGSGAGVPSG